MGPLSYCGAAMQRHVELDWLRGLMLVLMTLTHLPTWFSNALGQPFGFVSAAEGFVFLSAFLVGRVFGGVAREQGFAAMRTVVWRRAVKIYVAHAALLLFLLFALLPVAISKNAHGIIDLASFYVAHPSAALAGGLMLVYNPPLLDILPMYVLFMAASPLLLHHGMRKGWTGLLAGSITLWVLAQFDAGRIVYQALARVTGLPVPYNQTGAFSFLAWQLMWVLGMCAGTRSAGVVRRAARWPLALLVAAGVVALTFFVWRHVDGQVPASSALATLTDKWHLAPLRLLDFGALALIVVRMRDVIAAHAQRSALATLGKASLPVFCAHLVICLGALAVVQEPGARLQWIDSVLLGGALVVLYGAALACLAGRRLAHSTPAFSAPRPAPRTAR